MFEAGRYPARRFLDNADGTTRSPGRLRPKPAVALSLSRRALSQWSRSTFRRSTGHRAGLCRPGLSFTERGWPSVNRCRGGQTCQKLVERPSAFRRTRQRTILRHPEAGAGPVGPAGGYTGKSLYFCAFLGRGQAVRKRCTDSLGPSGFWVTNGIQGRKAIGLHWPNDRASKGITRR